MTRAELKQQAKDTLRGRWGKAIGMILLYQIILGLISFAANFVPFVGSVAIIVVTVPLSFGFIGQMLKFSRNEKVGFFDYFTIGFSNFGKSWSIVGNTLLKLLGLIIAYVVCTFVMVGIIIAAFVNQSLELLGIGIALVVVAFIIIYILLIVKSYLYVLTEYIGNDNNEMLPKDIVERSEQLMKGHRWELFVLELSFIGWALLSILTFGIGYLWLEPYMQITTIKFYESLASGREREDDNMDAIKVQ